MEKLEVNVEGMHCDGCSTRLQRVLGNLDGVSKAEVSLEEKKARLEVDPGVCTLKEVSEAIEDAGFSVGE